MAVSIRDYAHQQHARLLALRAVAERERTLLSSTRNMTNRQPSSSPREKEDARFESQQRSVSPVADDDLSEVERLVVLVDQLRQQDHETTEKLLAVKEDICNLERVNNSLHRFQNDVAQIEAQAVNREKAIEQRRLRAAEARRESDHKLRTLKQDLADRQAAMEHERRKAELRVEADNATLSALREHALQCEERNRALETELLARQRKLDIRERDIANDEHALHDDELRAIENLKRQIAQGGYA